VVSVEQWAEIRRLHFVERVAIKEIARRTGLARNTVRSALRSNTPPRYRRTVKRVSKLDPYKGEIEQLLKENPRIAAPRIRELIGESGYDGGKTILNEYLREVRPRFEVRRTYQRTEYRPGEILQFDLVQMRTKVPVGHGQSRRAWVLTSALGYSRAAAGALIFSRQIDDLLWGMGRCIAKLGALPERIVWDREAAIHAGGGRPTDPFAAFCGQLPVAWRILEAADPESKGMLERLHRYMRTNFEAARRFRNPDHFQSQLDEWMQKANEREHATLHERPVDRLAKELRSMRPLPDPMPQTDKRFIVRVPPQPYMRVDTNDYSVDPRAVGKRVEVRVGQRKVTAIALETAEVVASHQRSFAKRRTFTDPDHQALLDVLRGRRRERVDVKVAERPLARYDALIPS
jgi:transposase